MYALGEARSGPTVRIEHLLAALRERTAVDVVSGTRRARRGAWLRYLRSGRLGNVSGVYVETSSALPDIMDLVGLRTAKSRGLPVLSYIRDAYQLFRDEYPPPDLLHGIAARAFPMAVAALRVASTRLAFPTRGLAEAVLGRSAGGALLLPPGSPAPIRVPRRRDARSLLYVGDLRLASQGGADLLRAVDLARERAPTLELLCVAREGSEPATELPAWARLVRADSRQIPDLLGLVLACVIPRAPGRYNDLALPIKLMEYLAYGRPIVTTDRRETAAVVRAAGAGVVVDDGPAAMADGIVTVWNASESQRDAWSAAAHRAAEANAWTARAETILGALAR
jgi:glycosyltransferase involved in cell wall biosynthesis